MLKCIQGHKAAELCAVVLQNNTPNKDTRSTITHLVTAVCGEQGQLMNTEEGD